MRPKILHLKVVPVIQPVSFRLNRAFSLTWSASMQIYWRKESFQIRKEFNSHRIGLGPQHGRRFIVLEHQYGRREVMWKLSIGIRSLCNDDGDLNENGKKAIGLDWQDNNFAHASCFFCTFLPSLHDYDVKRPNSTFFGEHEYKTTTFLFFSWTSIQSFRIQLQKKLPTFDELNETE